MVINENQIYIYGGIYGYNEFLDDFWVFDTSCNFWASIEQEEFNFKPGKRAYHTAT